MKIKNEAAKAGFWFTFCNVLQRGIQFLATPIYTRLLSTEEYGRYSTFLTWCSLLAILVTFNLASGVFNNAMIKHSDDKDGYTSSMQALALIATVGCTIVYFLLFKWVESIMGMDIKNSLCMFSIIYFQMVIQLWSARKRYDFKYVGLIIHTVVFSLMVPVLGILFFNTIYRDENGFILGYTVANLVVGSILMIDTWRKKWTFYKKKYWNYALKFNIPLIPHYMSNMIMGQSDRVMIKYYNGDYYAGLYSLSYQISLAMTIVFQGINNAITPWTYRKMQAKEYEKIGMTTKLLCFGMTCPCAILLLLSPEIMLVLGGEEYLEAIWVIPPVVFATYLLFVIPLLLNILFYFEQNKIVMCSTATGAVVNIILNVLLLEKMGYIAAAYTTAIGYFVIVIVDYLFLRKTLKIKGIEKIYDIKVMIVCLFIVASICVACGLLYNVVYIIRYAVLFILVIVFSLIIWKNIKRAKKLFGINV